MLELNNVAITGRLVDDPKLKTDNSPVARCRIAKETGWGDSKKTSFISVTAFGKTAEFIAKHFEKGSAIYIEGHLEENTWEQDGSPKSIVRIIAEHVQFNESKADADARRARREQREPAAGAMSEPTTKPITADDLPF